MALRPSLMTRGLSGMSDGGPNDTGSPRDEAKKNMLKSMRPLPTQHYWNVYFDRQASAPPSTNPPFSSSSSSSESYNLDLLPGQISTVQDFWRYANNTPISLIKMRESIYLFKTGFKPIWEDRRNVNGGSWTFRVPKEKGPDFWTRVQLMAIGEKLQGCLDGGDQLCGVGLSVRFNSHLISIWHRDASKQKSIDNMLKTVLEELPEELKPKPDNYFYKKHSDHAGFNTEAARAAQVGEKKKTEHPLSREVKPAEEEEAGDGESKE